MTKNNLSMAVIFAMATILTPSITQANNSAKIQVTTADFSNLVNQSISSVARVNITKEVSKEALEKAQAAVLLKQFFGNKINIPDSITKPAVEHSYGSAFFVTDDGYLLTNHHVIAGADTITITLNDQRELTAKLIGTDKRSDIAVLKVEGNNFAALPIGDSSALKVGEPVLAIGSPFGFDYSASAGIVSAKARNFSRSASVPFIQTDVALNPGNSGGPLFNQNGEVIGINSRIFSKSGGYMGLSFSIPINEAMGIYNQLQRYGKVRRGYLGVVPQDIDATVAESLGLDKPVGAYISRVHANSPAIRAGLKSGDIIIQYADTPIRNANDLIDQFNQARPNQAFTIKVLRQGEKITITGNYGIEPDNMKQESKESSDFSENDIDLGLHLRILSTRELLDLRKNKNLRINGGLVITTVNPTGLAGRSGLQAGDIITSLNDQATDSIASFSRAHNSLPKKGVVTVEVIRGGAKEKIGLRIE